MGQERKALAEERLGYKGPRARCMEGQGSNHLVLHPRRAASYPTVRCSRGAGLCPEAFSQPSLLSVVSCGIHENTFSSITKGDVQVQKDLSVCTELSGGTTVYIGIIDWMQREIRALAPSRMEITTFTPLDTSTWWGVGCTPASQSIFQQMWVDWQDRPLHKRF